MQTNGRRRMWMMAAAALALVVLTLGLILFKPWLLFVDVRVDEEIPVIATSPLQPAPSASAGTGIFPSRKPAADEPIAGPVLLAEGSLISHEHATTGTVQIIQQPDRTRVLTLENLDTSNGPDIHVWLSAADVVEGRNGWYTAGSAAHHDLGLIKGNQGNQVYQIPENVDLSAYRSVDLWCVQFGVSFGAAQLSP